MVVKRFRFDFLTKDNIKYFKREANIFKVLKHEHIVRFFGVVIDPPSLGIVMQYGVNGDLFQNLERIRNDHIASIRAEERESASRRKKHRNSLMIDEMFIDQYSELETSESSQKNSFSNNPMITRKKSSDSSDIDSDHRGSRITHSAERNERSTINWATDRMTVGSRIVNTLSSVAGTRTNIVSTAAVFEPLICMHQVCLQTTLPDPVLI